MENVEAALIFLNQVNIDSENRIETFMALQFYLTQIQMTVDDNVKNAVIDHILNGIEVEDDKKNVLREYLEHEIRLSQSLFSEVSIN